MQAARVTRIMLSRIEPNPHNPRRLFDEEPLEILKESIIKLGILVPITVYPKLRNRTNPVTDSFVILDGERRWRCAKSIPKVRRIPAIVIEKPSDAENILVMFHIHNLREGWQLMPTALKLQVLMEKMGIRSEKKLFVLTKLSIGQIRRCKILLSYPKKFQNLMLAPPSRRLKSDFFIELQRIRGPALKEEFPPWRKRGDGKCIDLILRKYLRKKIRAVTEFRKLAEVYRGSVRLGKKQQFYTAFEKFLSDENATIDSVVVPGASFEKETREANRSAIRLRTQLEALELEAVASNEELIDTLNSLIKLIKKKLEDAMLIDRNRDRT